MPNWYTIRKDDIYLNSIAHLQFGLYKLGPLSATLLHYRTLRNQNPGFHDQKISIAELLKRVLGLDVNSRSSIDREVLSNSDCLAKGSEMMISGSWVKADHMTVDQDQVLWILDMGLGSHNRKSNIWSNRRCERNAMRCKELRR